MYGGLPERALLLSPPQTRPLSVPAIGRLNLRGSHQRSPFWPLSRASLLPATGSQGGGGGRGQLIKVVLLLPRRPATPEAQAQEKWRRTGAAESLGHQTVANPACHVALVMRDVKAAFTGLLSFRLFVAGELCPPAFGGPPPASMPAPLSAPLSWPFVGCFAPSHDPHSAGNVCAADS